MPGESPRTYQNICQVPGNLYQVNESGYPARHQSSVSCCMEFFSNGSKPEPNQTLTQCNLHPTTEAQKHRRIDRTRSKKKPTTQEKSMYWYVLDYTSTRYLVVVNPFRNAVPFWGQTILIPSSLPPIVHKRRLQS